MAHVLDRARLALAILGVATLLGAVSVHSAAAQSSGGMYDITVTAEVLEADAPVDVATTTVTVGADGLPAHGVVVTWLGDMSVMLEDARFARDAPAADGDGQLVIAGRGCGSEWDASSAGVSHACTADFQLIPVAHGESHEYPVRIYPEVGPLSLMPGVYTVEEPVSWSLLEDQGAGGAFTVRLVYTVSDAGSGVLSPPPAASGVSAGTWSGGHVDTLPQALSYWVADRGTLVGYVPGAPAHVNARFLARFADGYLPGGTILLVAR